LHNAIRSVRDIDREMAAEFPDEKAATKGLMKRSIFDQTRSSSTIGVISS
jgi:hypothetical protein